MTSTTPHRRRLQGTIVSTKMTKTVIVRVDRIKTHPKYGKKFTASTRFAVHAEQPDLKVGDKVWIEETRPLSATKRWRLISRV